MAESRRVRPPGQHLELDRIDRRYRDVEASVKDYFSTPNPRSAARFSGHAEAEIPSDRTLMLEEHGRGTSMAVFAALEAAFHLDFSQRSGKPPGRRCGMAGS